MKNISQWNGLFRAIFVVQVYLLACASARPPGRGVVIEGLGTLKREWIGDEVKLQELLRLEEKRRVKEVMGWCRRQLSEENVWIIDGVEGKGPTPYNSFKKRVHNSLVEDPDLVALQQQFRDGDRIFHFSSKQAGYGYICVRDQKVVYTYWQAIR